MLQNCDERVATNVALRGRATPLVGQGFDYVGCNPPRSGKDCRRSLRWATLNLSPGLVYFHGGAPDLISLACCAIGAWPSRNDPDD